MSQTKSLDLSDRQREMLLRGLRFVRRSYTLSFRDSGDMTDEERTDGLKQVQELNQLLEGGRRPSRRPPPAEIRGPARWSPAFRLQPLVGVQAAGRRLKPELQHASNRFHHYGFVGAGAGGAVSPAWNPQAL